MKEMRTLTIDEVTYKIVDGAVGSLDDLRTANKSSLVSAVNEVYEKTELASRLSLGVHTDGLIYIFVDDQPVGNGIELSAGGISGYVDENNTIIINNLPDGSYTVKYEMADGSTIDIGNLEVADEPAQAYINQIPASINADGDLFVGTNGEAGYKTGYRLSLSGGSESAQAGTEVTGFIPVKKSSVIRVKNIAYEGDSTRGVVGYDASFAKLATGSGVGLDGFLGTDAYDEGNGVRRSQALSHYTHFNDDSLAYIRICSTDINETSILTVDEEIV